MIDIKELRIGNIILYTPSGKKEIKPREACVQELLEKSCIVLDLGLKLELFYESASTQPIPLSEEILIRCGFEKSLPKYYLINNSMAISTADDKFKVIVGNFVCQVVVAEIEYLHQLQNLYYAATNKELILKGG